MTWSHLFNIIEWVLLITGGLTWFCFFALAGLFLFARYSTIIIEDPYDEEMSPEEAFRYCWTGEEVDRQHAWYRAEQGFLVRGMKAEADECAARAKELHILKLQNTTEKVDTIRSGERRQIQRFTKTPAIS